MISFICVFLRSIRDNLSSTHHPFMKLYSFYCCTQNLKNKGHYLIILPCIKIKMLLNPRPFSDNYEEKITQNLTILVKVASCDKKGNTQSTFCSNNFQPMDKKRTQHYKMQVHQLDNDHITTDHQWNWLVNLWTRKKRPIHIHTTKTGPQRFHIFFFKKKHT